MIGYIYRATVVRWIDGDSLEADVDLGFFVTTRQQFRLLGVDTPERGRAGYAEAIALVREIAPPGASVYIASRRTEKYGRWLATVYPPPAEPGADRGVSINARLLSAGLALPYGTGLR